VKTIGALVGLAAGVFLLIDRFLKDRPIVYIRPRANDKHTLELVIRNVAKEPIFISSVVCSPAAMRVSFSEDVGEILEASAGETFTAIIPPEAEEVFY
jgi:hypothetical protein